MIKFQKENLMYNKAEIDANLIHHYKDAEDYTTAKGNLNWDSYQMLDEEGCICFVAARDEEEKLIGYTVFIMTEHIHHQVLHAVASVTFILPEYRGRGIAKDMIACSEIILKRLDVHTVEYSVTDTLDYSPMLEKEGFRLIERIYGKEL